MVLNHFMKISNSNGQKYVSTLPIINPHLTVKPNEPIRKGKLFEGKPKVKK